MTMSTRESRQIRSKKNGGGGKTADDDAWMLRRQLLIHFSKPKPPNLSNDYYPSLPLSMLHTKMDSFFERHAAKFDQEWDDYLQSGETLEQYEIFKEYEELLDENLTEFVHKKDSKALALV